MRSKGQKIDKTIAAYVIQNLVARSVYEFEIFFGSELSRFTLGGAYNALVINDFLSTFKILSIYSYDGKLR